MDVTLYDPAVDAAFRCPVHKVWVTLGTGAECVRCEADFYGELGETWL